MINLFQIVNFKFVYVPRWWNGIHEGLKILCRKACGFDSHPGHHPSLPSADGATDGTAILGNIEIIYRVEAKSESF